MEDAVGVHEVEAQRHLNKVIEDEGLAHQTVALLLNLVGKIATVAVLHNNTQGVLVLRQEGLLVVDNVGVGEPLHEIHFSSTSFSFFFGESTNLHHFNAQEFPPLDLAH